MSHFYHDIDLGQFKDYDETDSYHIVGTTDYGECLNDDWKRRHSLGKSCPGPGFGEPECGRLIEDTAERCHLCARLRRAMEDDASRLYVIRERPAREVDTVEYGARLKARAVQIPKLLELARQRKHERDAQQSVGGHRVQVDPAG